MEYLLAIDQGTTGTTAVLMNQNLQLIAEATAEVPQHFPKPGWVEHDLDDIWATVAQTIHEVVQHIDARKIATIGITNQRETICFWDRNTGAALGRAIVWQDRRTADLCAKLKADGLEPFFQERTGLLLDPYFSGTKVAWALEHWSDVKTAYDAGRLAVGSIDSFLISRLSGNAVHVTEPSNASRSLCFDLRKHEWSPDLSRALGIPCDIWPEVLPSTGIFALTRGLRGLPDGIPIAGALGDQQAALLGQNCTREGLAKCTYGTGAFVLLNTGKTPIKSEHRLLSTVAWARSKDDYTYALEGSAFIAGAAVQWLRDGLKIITGTSDVETLAAQVPTSDGVVFVPALTGLGAPYWDPTATGMFTGITRGTTDAHMARAVLEGIAYQIADILGAMGKDLGRPVLSLNVDGGASANNLLMQFQADILDIPLCRPMYLETTSLGAIFAAGLGTGIFMDFDDIEKTWKKDRDFTPSFTEEQRLTALKSWHQAVARVRLKP